MSARPTARDYVPAAPREYTSKAKNAQEAHEAIRPTDVARTPDSVARYLNREQLRLYELVWKRAVASQMQSAELDQVAVDVASGGTRLRANGSIVAFDGYLKLYREDVDDAPEGAADESRMLPPMHERDPLEPRPRHRRPALHPAAAALLRGEPGQEDGGAGHRPPQHLRQHPDRAARPQLRAAWRTSASSRRIAAGWSPRS